MKKGDEGLQNEDHRSHLPRVCVPHALRCLSPGSRSLPCHTDHSEQLRLNFAFRVLFYVGEQQHRQQPASQDAGIVAVAGQGVLVNQVHSTRTAPLCTGSKRLIMVLCVASVVNRHDYDMTIIRVADT